MSGHTAQRCPAAPRGMHKGCKHLFLPFFFLEYSPCLNLWPRCQSFDRLICQEGVLCGGHPCTSALTHRLLLSILWGSFWRPSALQGATHPRRSLGWLHAFSVGGKEADFPSSAGRWQLLTLPALDWGGEADASPPGPGRVRSEKEQCPWGGECGRQGTQSSRRIPPGRDAQKPF